MKKRLETIGQRAISNVVDITNYVLMDVGQPLHTFDIDRLNENRIVIRNAHPGEKILTLDQTTAKLDPHMLVIADARKPIALAGVMGGADSQVDQTTKTILLESAHFDPLTIRRASRALGIASDSSYRFERNVSQFTVEWASRRAAALLVEWAGGKVAKGLIDNWPNKPQTHSLPLRLSRLKSLLGIEIAPDTVVAILNRLGFDPKLNNDNAVACTVPPWRCDITIEADLIEEVIRIHGYQHIPTQKKINITVTSPNAHQRTRKKVVSTLHGCGYFETISPGFCEDQYLPLFAEDHFKPLRVSDFSRKTNNALRHTLLPSLLTVKKHNQDAQNQQGDFYELAAVHQTVDGQSLPQENIMLGLITTRTFRDLRGVIEAILNRLDKHASLTCSPCALPWAKPSTGAQFYINNRSIGFAGLANQKILKAYDLATEPVLAEIAFDALIDCETDASLQLQQIIRFPPICRDLSIVIDENLPWTKIENNIQNLNIDDLRRTDFIGIYRGKGIDHQKKCLTLSLQFRRTNQTLTHPEVDAHQNKILNALKSAFQAKLRA